MDPSLRWDDKLLSLMGAGNKDKYASAATGEVLTKGAKINKL